MKSRITIEVDFNHGNAPVIQILQKDSDDVRDRLLASFLQSLAHTSRWAVISYEGGYLSYGEQSDVNRWKITPITPEEIQNEIKLMNAVLANNTKEV